MSMHKLPIYLGSILLLLGIMTNTWAWNVKGHEVVAAIAYQQLQPKARAQVNDLVDALNGIYPATDFIRAAAWPDLMRQRGIETFTRWHYIQLPYVIGKVRYNSYDKQNIVWAVRQAHDMLKNPQANRFEQGLFLRFYAHLIGDIHQPLHSINRYSQRFITGDHGGMRYVIRAGNIHDLHSYWDQAINFLNGENTKKSPSQLAEELQRRYPRNYFKQQLQIKDPWLWAQQGHRLAKKVAYRLPYRGKPTAIYQRHAQKITTEQMTLAGYRLADALNALYADTK